MSGPTRAPAKTVLYADMRQLGDAEGRRGLVRTHSSAASAFPKHCDYACSLTVHKRGLRLDERVGIAVLLLALAGAAVLTWGGDPVAAGGGCATDTECRCAVDCLEPAR